MTSFTSGGYDSDVEREKAMDYSSKTYSAPIREPGEGVKPHLQEGAGSVEKGRVSRSAPVKTKVVTSSNRNPNIQVRGAVTYTVEPPNKGHLGTRASVLYSEVSFIRSVLYRRFHCIQREHLIPKNARLFELTRSLCFHQKAYNYNYTA